MKKINKTPLAIAIGTIVVSTSAISVAGTQTNLFAMTELTEGYMQLAEADSKSAKEGKCGEGKCGGMMNKGKMKKGMESSCGGMMKGKEGKCGNMNKAKEGKCGEGKCGGSKK